ncbi:diguanylate cyclase [Aliiglaciecola sp. LCG003]|uniref:diguanylate cyclase n=1 Tax=Aliiglaciecola sp. LCG003 TaxID=3053655 RepID=UPI002572B25F|nr:diguanylate cyclase [Aliiglaciecola sp. LCG003]WJG10705.1 diguanylate cyclase [Aliiglaciecola sp. LCG003]
MFNFNVITGCALVYAMLLCLPIQAQGLDQPSDILLQQIAAARNKGDMSLADELAARLNQYAHQSNDLNAIADANYQLARNAMERNRYQQAQDHLNAAISAYQDLDNQNGLANAYRQLGLTYRYQANYPQALEYIYLAMQIYQQMDNKSAISSTHNSIGLVLEKLGQYEAAAQAHQKALEIHYELGDQQGIASALYNLGDLRRVMGDRELALVYFQDALKIDSVTGNLKNLAYSHHKIGYLYMVLGDFDNARLHINQALSGFKQISAPRDTDWALSSLAELEMKLGNFDLARDIIDGVILRAQTQQYNSLLADAYYVSAELAYLQDNSQTAADQIDMGLQQARANHERQKEAEFEALRVKVHVKNEAYKQAFESLQREKHISEEILNTKRIGNIANLQAQTEFIRRAQQIELLKKETALQKANIEQQNLSRNLWILAVIASFLLLFLLYSRRVQIKLNKRLGEQVEQRTQELKQKNIELQIAYQEMETISLTDQLTGIHNRRYLENQIDADLEQSLRLHQDWLAGKTDKPVHADIVVFMIDMDRFKSINDIHGHVAGDAVLIQLTQRLAQVFRQSDYLTRWGGEEFVAVARFINRDDAPVLAQRVVDHVAQTPFQLPNGAEYSTSCSVGYACYPLYADNSIAPKWNTLISIADACLYMVKSAGRNGWVGIDKVQESTVPLEVMTPEKILNWQNDKKVVLKRSFK